MLSRLFRRLFLERLQHAFDTGELRFFSALTHLSEPAQFARYLMGPRHVEWVVYAKQPFGGPQQVLDYLGRYTHRVAVSNNRLVGLTDAHVTFRWKDYRRPDKPRVMQLPPLEFIRRFLLHVLPRGLQRIRHYGLLSNRLRESRLTACRHLLNVEPDREARTAPEPDYRDRYAKLTGRSLYDCPVCSRGRMLCYLVRYREHHRRVPDEFRSARLQHRFQHVPQAPVDTLGQTSPTAACHTLRRLFIPCVVRISHP